MRLRHAVQQREPLMRYIGSTNFAGARYGQGIDEHSAFQVGLQYFGYGSMSERDAAGIEMGTFSASDIAFSAGYTRDISGYWRGGAVLKYLYSKIAQVLILALVHFADARGLLRERLIGVAARALIVGSELVEVEFGREEGLALR